MIHAKNLPLSLWAEAVSTTVHVLNRTASSIDVSTTPYEMWMGKKPNLSYLRVFGSEAYVHIEKQFRKKLNAKAKKMLLVGYQAEYLNYRLYDPTTKRVLVSRNVVFNETLLCENILPVDHNNRELRILANKQETEIHLDEPEATENRKKQKR